MAHDFAFVTDLPLTGAHVTLDSEGAVIGTTCRILEVGEYKEEYRNKEEDEDEAGILQGERKWDLQSILPLKIAIPSDFDMAKIRDGNIVTLALASGHIMKAKLDGIWQIDSPSIAFKNKGRIEVSITLRKNAGFTPTAQAA